MSNESDVERVIKAARAYGWRHNLTERGHHQFLSPDGENIVHHSGTPGDQRSWNNFKADMRRAGFDAEAGQPCEARNGATTNLGEVLAERLRPPADPTIGSKVTARWFIRDYLRQHPGESHVGPITEGYLALRPDANSSNVSVAMSALKDAGEVVRTRHAHYRLATDEDRRRLGLGLEPTADGLPAPKAPERVPEFARDEIADSRSQPPAGAAPAPADSTGDEQLDSELAELDSAVTQVLDGFSTLERLLRRHRETMRTLAQLRKLLAVIK